MTPSARNQDASQTHPSDIVMQAIETALYYPSLKGNPWDDELLPSED
jgi:hypothetical protein